MHSTGPQYQTAKPWIRLVDAQCLSHLSIGGGKIHTNLTSDLTVKVEVKFFRSAELNEMTLFDKHFQADRIMF